MNNACILGSLTVLAICNLSSFNQEKILKNCHIEQETIVNHLVTINNNLHEYLTLKGGVKLPKLPEDERLTYTYFNSQLSTIDGET